MTTRIDDFALPLSLDAGAEITPPDITTIVAGDDAQLSVLLTGVQATDVIAQVIFTAKVALTDSDAAATTIQHFVNPAAAGASEGIVSVPLSPTTQLALVRLTPAETARLTTAHFYNVRAVITRNATRAIISTRNATIMATTSATAVTGAGIHAAGAIAPSGPTITATGTVPAVSGTAADVIKAFGPTDIVSFWEFSPANVTLDSNGRFAQATDVRGASAGPVITGHGATLPSFSASPGSVTTDGTQNGLSTAESALYDISQTACVVAIGTFPTGSGYPVVVGRKSDINQYAGFGDNLSNGSISLESLSGAGSRVQQASLVAPSASPRLMIWSTAAPLNPGAGTTLDRWDAYLGVVGELRQFQHVLATTQNYLSETMALQVGNGEAFGHYYPTTIYALLFLKVVPSLAQVQALTRYAIAKGAVMVANPPAGVVCAGDSITNGYGISGSPWTTPLQTNLGASGYTVSARGVNGRRMSDIAAELNRMLTPDANPIRPNNWLVLWAGTNDICADNALASTVLTNAQTIADAWRATGGKVVVVTMLKRGDCTGTKETQRQALNTGLLGMVPAHADMYYDAASESIFSDPTNATYFQADQIHPTDAAQSTIEAGVENAIRTQLLHTFTAPNSSTAIPAADTGQATIVGAGVWGITSNQATLVTPPGGGAYANVVWDSLLADCTLQITLPQSAANSTGMTARFIDNNNRLHLEWSNTTLTLYKIVAGVGTVLGSYTGTRAANDVMKWVMSGGNHTVYQNGVQRFTATDSTYLTGTKHGLSTLTAAALFDNFSVKR